MVHYRTVLIIGIIEIFIGGASFIGTLSSLLFEFNSKSPNALIFILATGAASFMIGVGILKYNRAAWRLLLYFSSVIVLTKFLTIFGIIQLNGALATAIPDWIKNIISIVYHSYLIYYLRKPEIQQAFHTDIG